MTTKTTVRAGSRRLPRGLKKKLEASLGNLTPRQAGRLYVLYLVEGSRKGKAHEDYPPIQELWAAWKARAKSEPRFFNGFLLLTQVANEANNWAQGEAYRLLFAAQTITSRLRELLLQDSASEVARYAGGLLSDMPRPVSLADHAVMVEWTKGGATMDLGELAGELAAQRGDEVAALQGFKPLRVDPAFWQAHKDDFEDPLDSSRFMETRELRALWVEEVGDRLLTETFGGDREALDSWVKVGGFAGPGFTDKVVDAIADEIYDRLVDMVKAGELEGGPAFYGSYRGLFSPVMVHEGRLPAWAALRAVWRGWLYDHGFFVREDFVIDPQAIEGLYSIWDIEGDLEGDRLTQVAATFLADCRSRPWGEGLKADIDPEALGRFLVTVESPMTEITAPAWGFVDWEAFRSREGDESQEWELDWVATMKSLNAKGPELGFGPVTYSDAYVESMYYPTQYPEEKRQARQNVDRLLKTLRVSHRAFAYTEAEKQPLPGFLGVEFFTPLEETVKLLGRVFGQAATFGRIFDLLSEEYFGGLPILTERNREALDFLEAGLAGAEEELAHWLKKIDAPIWNVDTSTLQLVKDTVNEDEAREWADYVVAVARRRTRLEDASQFALGPDDEGSARGKKGAR